MKYLLALLVMTPCLSYCEEKLFDKVHDLYLIEQTNIRVSLSLGDENMYWYHVGKQNAYDNVLYMICEEYD